MGLDMYLTKREGLENLQKMKRKKKSPPKSNKPAVLVEEEDMRLQFKHLSICQKEREKLH